MFHKHQSSFVLFSSCFVIADKSTYTTGYEKNDNFKSLCYHSNSQSPLFADHFSQYDEKATKHIRVAHGNEGI